MGFFYYLQSLFVKKMEWRGKWVRGPDMNSPRAWSSSAMLHNGMLMIFGGVSDDAELKTTSFYDPVNNIFKRGPDMFEKRAASCSVTLRDGRVIVIGGSSEGKNHTSTEIYDPVADRFSRGPNMITERSAFSASAMSDGRVLVMGGVSNNVIVKSTEIFDPVRNEFVPGPDLIDARTASAACLLKDGSVMIFGGVGAVPFIDMYGTSQSYEEEDVSHFRMHRSTEIYNPAKKEFERGPYMKIPRGLYITASVLSDGKVLVRGGDSARFYGGRFMVEGESYSNGVATELYVPAYKKFVVGPAEDVPVAFSSAATLPNGNVIVIGGASDPHSSVDPGALSTTSLYIPAR